jgi:hypothetical protein
MVQQKRESKSPGMEDPDMPSVEHETPIELIRQDPLLVLDVVRMTTGLPLEGAVTVELVPADVSNPVPAQYLTDGVAVIRAEDGEPLLAVVIEPQGRDRRTKEFSWPAYVCQVRKTCKCDTILIAICWDQDAAKAAGETICTGHPGFDLTPFVSAPGMMSYAGASHEPVSGPYWTLYLGYLRYVDMDTDQGQHQILRAAQQIPAEHRKSCITLMLAVASAAARKAMEAKMATVTYSNDFIESFVAGGRAEGEAVGRAEGEAVGRAEGEALGLADAIIEVLRVRGIEPTPDHVTQAHACTDMDQLHEWHRTAVTARTADEVFSSSARGAAVARPCPSRR